MEEAVAAPVAPRTTLSATISLPAGVVYTSQPSSLAASASLDGDAAPPTARLVFLVPTTQSRDFLQCECLLLEGVLCWAVLV